MPADLMLYSYFRSSAAFRVRIALNLKGLKPEMRFVHLLKDGGQHHSEAYKRDQSAAAGADADAVTAMRSASRWPSSNIWTRSRPSRRLLPKDALARARVRQIALGVACDIHPIANLRVLQYLKNRLGADEAALLEWQRHWIGEGLAALEQCWPAIRRRGNSAMAINQPWRTLA